MGKKITLGLVEKITLLGPEGKEEKVTARIDTGATSSSLDHQLGTRLGLGPILRTKLVKSASGTKHRPIVKARVKMDGLVLEEDFTLADRSHMTYPVLIGQNILTKGNFFIDPNKKSEP